MSQGPEKSAEDGPSINYYSINPLKHTYSGFDKPQPDWTIRPGFKSNAGPERTERGDAGQPNLAGFSCIAFASPLQAICIYQQRTTP